MRIIAISDTESRHEQVSLPEGDVLVCAGDITHNGWEREVAGFNEWLGGLGFHDIVVIAGNHDVAFERSPETRKLLTNCHYLQDEGVEIGGFKFWGSPWQPVFGNWAFNLRHGKPLADKWALIPEDTDVLVTHGPPFGILDLPGFGNNAGCQELLERVRKIAPQLHVFGHIHESAGTFEEGNTLFVNVAQSVATISLEERK